MKMDVDWSSPWVDHTAYIIDHLQDMDLTAEEALALLVIEESLKHDIPITQTLIQTKLKTTIDHADALLNALSDKGCLTFDVAGGKIVFHTDGVLEEVSRQGVPIEKSLIREFEEGLQHPLSSQEMQRVIDLGALYDQDRILLALDEACAYNNRSLNYVERVLVSWANKGLSTEDLKRGIRNGRQ